MEPLPNNDPSSTNIPITNNDISPASQPSVPSISGDMTPNPAPSPAPPVTPASTPPPSSPDLSSAPTEPSPAGDLTADKPKHGGTSGMTWVFIALGAILAIAAVLAGVWWYQNNYNTESPVSTSTPSTTTTPKSSISPANLSTSTPLVGASDYIQLNSTPPVRVTFTTPSTWGPLLVPILDATKTITEGAFKGKTVAANNPIDNLSLIKSLVFSSFPYLSTNASDNSGAPSISLMQYPATFTADSTGTQPLTSAQKSAVVKTLEDVYSQSSIGSLVAEQTNTASGKSDKPLLGAWWGNVGTNTDKLVPKYYSSTDKTLRGVGFFVNEGQDTTFYPQYRIVLVNPTDKVVVQVSVPLTGLPEFASMIAPATTPETTTATKARIQSGYDYLEKVSTGSTDAAQLLSTLNSLVGTMTIANASSTPTPASSATPLSPATAPLSPSPASTTSARPSPSPSAIP